MLTGVGSALVAVAAFLALTLALAPVPDEQAVGPSEHFRRQRIATVKGTFAAVSGFAGAALLITSAWPWSVVGLGGAAVLLYAALVVSTYRSNRFVVKQIRLERWTDRDEDNRPGRILASTAAWMSVAPWDAYDAGPVFFGAAGDPGSIRIAEGVERMAEARARLRWAVRHPYDVNWPTPRMAYVWLVLRVRYMVGKPI